MAVKPIPDDYPPLSPYLAIDGAAEAIEFYKKAFGAVERMRLAAPGGRIGHAEIQIGDALVMLADEHPEHNFRGPKTLGGSSVTLHMYVENVDAFCERAVNAGATLVRPLADQFYGDRSGQLRDPYGNVWSVATHIEDVTPEEMQKRMAALFGS